MDTVMFDGVQYVKASVAAKEFHYTSDYIGQLCRSKKIDARLVGRTWFVSPKSIREHKQTKYQKTSRVDDAQDTVNDTKIPPKTKPSRKEISPVITSKTAKLMSNNALQARPDISASRKLIVWYEPDQETLIPHLTKKIQPSKTVRIEQVGAKKVKVSSEKKRQVSFSPSVLPDVALSGKLTITSFPDKVTEIETEKKPSDVQKNVNIKDISDKPDFGKNKKSSMGIVSMTDPESPVKIGVKKPEINSTKVADVSRKATAPSLSKKSTESALASSFTPVSVQTPVEIPISMLVRVSPLIATFVALVCVVIIFSASAIVVVSDSIYQSQVTLQVANLLEILNR